MPLPVRFCEALASSIEKVCHSKLSKTMRAPLLESAFCPRARPTLSAPRTTENQSRTTPAEPAKLNLKTRSQIQANLGAGRYCKCATEHQQLSAFLTFVLNLQTGHTGLLHTISKTVLDTKGFFEMKLCIQET
eukprot:1553547-Rhodomonas_salina.1